MYVTHMHNMHTNVQRACTYPAPSHQYSRPPTAPRYLPLPSTIRPGSTYATPSSQIALKRIHQVLSRTTTYSEQFPAPNTPRVLPNVLQTAYSFRSRVSHRPWTAESRGKYNRVAMPLSSAGLDASNSADRSHTVKYSSNEQDNSETDNGSTTSFENEPDTNPIKIDASTQTENEYFITATTIELPCLFPIDQKLPGDDLLGLNELPNVDTRSQDSQQSTFTPRSAQSTRRLMTLFNGFNKTDVLKRFHEDFPEKTADIREYSTHEGKRHFIHGSHSYYYH